MNQCPQCGNLHLFTEDCGTTLPISYNPFVDPDRYAFDYLHKWKPFREKCDPESVIAINPHLPASLIERLSQNPSDDVRSGIALNPSTPSEILKEVATSGDELIRACVARNLSITSEILDILLKDDCLDVITALKNNAALSEDDKARVKQRLRDYWREEHADHHIHNPLDPYEGDEPTDDRYLPTIEYGVESPLNGWHYDEDNGWLDYYPED